ncbi:MAG: dTMP kinase [Shewanella sp.]
MSRMTGNMAGIKKQVVIALDGPDYSGKSTLARRLTAALSAMGFRVLMHAHPCGTTDTGILARRLLLTSANQRKVAEAMAADFLHTLDNVITDDYDIVILDRWMPVTMVNQGEDGRDVVLSKKLASHPRAPSFYITLTTDYQTAKARMEERRIANGIDWDDVISAPILASEEAWNATVEKYRRSADICTQQTKKEIRVNQYLESATGRDILCLCESILRLC